MSDDGRIIGLVRQLGSKDWESASEAQRALVRVGRAAVPRLCDALEEEDPSVAWRVAWVLGRIWDRRALPSLCRVLQETGATQTDSGWMSDAERKVSEDQRALLRIEVIDALRLLRNPAAVPLLCEALFDPYLNVRKGAFNALAHIGAPAAPAVARVLTRLPPDAAIPAAKLLGSVGDDRAIRPLCELLGRGPWSVRLGAVDALAALARRSRAPELRAAIPELKRLASPWRPIPDGVQAGALLALRRIELVTHEVQSVPRSAEAPDPDAETLPRPSVAGVLATENLPRFVGECQDECDQADAAEPRSTPWLRRLRQLFSGGPEP